MAKAIQNNYFSDRANNQNSINQITDTAMQQLAELQDIYQEQDMFNKRPSKGAVVSWLIQQRYKEKTED